jgi:hypothetical protein
MDYETARKTFLDIEQSKEIDKNISRERFYWTKMQQALQEMLQPPPPQDPNITPPGGEQVPPEVMAQMQQQMMQQQMMQQQGGGMPPEMGQQGVQPGMPLQEPLPPEYMEG